MSLEKVNLTVLVVDDDETSLAIIANILNSWHYKDAGVLTSNNAGNALKILREFEGFLDLVIAEVRILRMNEFEFRKRVKDEFQLPVIMMSSDIRHKFMSMNQENEAAYLLKPIYADDLKDIWKYALAARKGKLVIHNASGSSEGESSPGEKIIIQDVNSSSAPSTVTHDSKGKRKYSKRKSVEMDEEIQSVGSYRVQKKPKVVWTTYLHNMFLSAIKVLGYDKAVPKKILEVMNVPYLTRENVASHLQKYRIFLRKMAERGLLDGVSGKILKSNFASGLTPSMMKEIQIRSEKLRVPVDQYLKNVAHLIKNGGIANCSSPFNQGTIVSHQVQTSAYLNSTELGRGRGQLPKGMYSGLMHQNHQALNANSLNQVRLGQSCFGSQIGANNMHQTFLGNYANNLLYNAGPNFPSYGMEHGLMTSASGLTRSLNLNNGSLLGNQCFQHGLGNGNMASSSNSNDPWNNSTCYPTSSNSYGIQLNDGPQTFDGGVGIMSAHANNNNSNFGMVHNRITTNDNILVSNLGHNNNNFGFVNVTQNANLHFEALGHSNNSFGFVNTTRRENTLVPPLAHSYESFRLENDNQNENVHVGMTTSGHGNSAFAARNESVSDLPEASINYANQVENVSRIPILPQHLSGHVNGNVASNEHQYNGSSSTDGEARRLENDISELFLMTENMEFLNEIEETPDANECLNSDFSSFSLSHVLQPSEQPQTTSNVIDPSIESDINQQKSPSSSVKDSNQNNAGFVDWESFDRFWMEDVSLGKQLSY
ncbi:hypothetical protein RIF29_13363 [Crotalaria pallida]|uniref:Response regulatory domain-containing protein n=1 Tax=Crotalaria pallida TaxID=3830 RepID=A0AAN9IP54_CROPI